MTFLVEHLREDGSIGECNRSRNYTTSVAIVALQATGNERYRPIIDNAQKFLAGLQVDKGEGYDRQHP